MKRPKLSKLKSGILKGNRKIRNRVVAGAVATATALSLLVGSAVDNPGELVKPPSEPAAIVEVVTPVPDNDFDDGVDESAPDEKKKSIKARIKEIILKMPLAVRLLVCIPLWIAGTAIIAAAGALNVPVFQPFITAAVKIAVAGAVFMGLFTATVKAVAPDIPVKKILKKKNVAIILFAVTVLEAAATAIDVFVENGTRYTALAKCAFMLTSMTVIAVSRLIRKKRSIE